MSILSSVSLSKQFELLALKLDFAQDQSITVMGCHRPPSACNEALSSLSDIIARFNMSELVLVGDLNLDWLTSASNSLKSVCDSFNLAQLIHSPTRPYAKQPTRSLLIDLIITNVPHKYTGVGIFANDLSDHCAIATVRNAKLPKTKP